MKKDTLKQTASSESDCRIMSYISIYQRYENNYYRQVIHISRRKL